VLKTLLANHENPGLLPLNAKDGFHLVVPLICEAITPDKTDKEDLGEKWEATEDDLEEIPF